MRRYHQHQKTRLTNVNVVVLNVITNQQLFPCLPFQSTYETEEEIFVTDSYYYGSFSEYVSKGENSFSKSGYNNWKKQSDNFRSNEGSNAHTLCFSKATGFRNSLKYGSVHKLDIRRCQFLSENHQYFVALRSSVYWSLGHTDEQWCDFSLLSSEGETFIYVSPEYQNHFLLFISKNIYSQIFCNMKKAGIYTVIMDETQDWNYMNMLPLVYGTVIIF